MSIRIRPLGHGDCDVEHGETGTRLRTSKSVAFGGSGTSFSSTDLLAVALGTCIATDLEPVADRNGLPSEQMHLVVDKRLSLSPKRVEALHVTVHVPEAVSDLVMQKLQRAAAHCLVHRSLRDDVDVRIEIVRQAGP